MSLFCLALLLLLLSVQWQLGGVVRESNESDGHLARCLLLMLLIAQQAVAAVTVSTSMRQFGRILAMICLAVWGVILIPTPRPLLLALFLLGVSTSLVTLSRWLQCQSSRRDWQFSMRHLMAWSTLTAIACGAVRAAEVSPRELLEVLLLIGLTVLPIGLGLILQCPRRSSSNWLLAYSALLSLPTLWVAFHFTPARVFLTPLLSSYLSLWVLEVTHFRPRRVNACPA